MSTKAARSTSATTSQQSTEDHVLGVAIVGAGPAGMACLKEIASQCPNLLSPSEMEGGNSNDRHSQKEVHQRVAVFEETSSLGGLWNRQGQPQRLNVPCFCHDSNDENFDDTSIEARRKYCIETSSQPVYENLITNLPKDLCSFLDFPYPSDVDFMLPATKVHEYYQNYFDVKHPHLKKYVYFNTRVEKCWKQQPGVWMLETSSTPSTGKSSERKHHPRTQVWKAKRLVICTGHFRKANVPSISGLRYFQGKLMHSSAFDSPRHPKFKEKTVVVVGGMASATDMAGLLAQSGGCKRVVLSVRSSKAASKVLIGKIKKCINEGTVVLRCGIDFIDEAGFVHFVQGGNGKKTNKSTGNQEAPSPSSKYDTEKPDIILFGTGYRYYYPFLPTNEMNFLSNMGLDSYGSDSSDVDCSGYKMERLYKRVLYVDDPSIAFIGITNLNFSPLIVLDYQAKWYVHIVLKKSLEDGKFDRWFQTNKHIMEDEIDSRKDDKTQDALFLNFPSYCTSLARDVPGVDGYWMQILKHRLPLHIYSLWLQRHPCMYWMIPALTLIVTAAVIPFLGYFVTIRKHIFHN